MKSKDSIPKDSVARKLKGRRKGSNIKAKDSVSIRDYKIVSYHRDTTFLDTTLTIKKEYKYNYIREDDFELMPFANMGQPYNELGKTFSKGSYYPRMGATAKHARYFEF